jgi:hypothetical protein
VTTLIAWVGVDERAPASLYVASDSRITWRPSERWDHGAKTFASPTTPDVLGYCGDALVPALVLPQFIACLGAGLVGERWKHRRTALQRLVEDSVRTVPRAQRREFEVVYCGREGQGMTATFRVGILSYRPRSGTSWRGRRLPSSSRLLYAGGSGAEHVERHRRRWNASRSQGGTSRAEYSAFVDALAEGRDAATGGPPQLVGLYRVGNGRHYGTSYKGGQFVQGAPVGPQVDGTIEWRNELFERVSGPTQRLLRDAQRHQRPSGGAAS